MGAPEACVGSSEPDALLGVGEEDGVGDGVGAVFGGSGESPKPGGKIDFGESCPNTGMAVANKARASIWRTWGRLAKLIWGHRNLLARKRLIAHTTLQEKQYGHQHQHSYDRFDEPRHETSFQKPANCLLPQPAPLCIAPAAMNAPKQPDQIEIARPIVLVGLMGVGKTTVGKRLAQRLNLQFVDADTEIELAAGHTIPEIFERFGEANFRDGERRVISRLIDGTPKVIATGGGAFMNDETRALILAETIAIWIDADIAVLAERVKRRNNRPLLQGKDPYKTLSELAAARNPIYALAPIHIKSRQSPQDQTVEAIMKALR